MRKFANLSQSVEASAGCTAKEVLACRVYSVFAKKRASKAVAAQYLSDRLLERNKEEKRSHDYWRRVFPQYLVEAIDFVTSGAS